jgi:phage terminase small subunit
MSEKQYTLKELQKKLTEKEKIFCHEYIIDWNGARAARSAGYSENSAREIAHSNLTKVHNQQYIEFIKQDIEKEAGITKLRNLNELSKIAYSSVEHIHDDWIELKDWEKIKEDNPYIMSAIESIDTKVEYRTYRTDEDPETDVEIKYVKIKFFGKIHAIQEINKMMGYNAPDKIEQKNINYNASVTKEEAKEISDALEDEC